MVRWKNVHTACTTCRPPASFSSTNLAVVGHRWPGQALRALMKCLFSFDAYDHTDVNCLAGRWTDAKMLVGFVRLSRHLNVRRRRHRVCCLRAVDSVVRMLTAAFADAEMRQA